LALRAQAGGKLAELWVSTIDKDNPVDFEMGNHFTAAHPNSPFVNRLMLRAFTPWGRVSVMNRDVTVVRGGEPKTSTLADRKALRALLSADFGIDLPEAEAVRVPSVPEWSSE